MKKVTRWWNTYSLRRVELPSSGRPQHLNLATLRVSLLWGAQRKNGRTLSRNGSSLRSLERAVNFLSKCHYFIKIIRIHNFRKLIIYWLVNRFRPVVFFCSTVVTAFDRLSFMLNSGIASCARTLASPLVLRLLLLYLASVLLCLLVYSGPAVLPSFKFSLFLCNTI